MWNVDLYNPNDSQDDCAVDIEADMEQANCIEDLESPEQRDVNAASNVSRLITP
jgi:hypothetical protein